LQPGLSGSLSVSRSLKAHVSLALVTIIWGCTFPLIKAALADSSPLMLNAVRMSLAAVLLAIYYRKKLASLTRRGFVTGATVGLFLGLGYAFQTAGLRLTTPSKSAFLTGISTVLVPLVLVLFWRTRIHRWRVVGILMALCGLFLMTVPAGRQAIADFANVNSGDLLTIACAFAFAFQIVLLGRSTQRFPFEQMAVLQVGVGALLTAIMAPFLEHPHFRPTPTVVATVLVTGILGTAVAFTVQAWAQQFTPATHAALIFNLEPVFAWLTSFIFLHERLGIRAGAGALLILAGILISELLGNVNRNDKGPGDLPDPKLAAPSEASTFG
jgi:drug/metabolite transporter (DMT)-like permease